MQQRNFVLFMVLSIVLFIGWTWAQQQIWPPKKHDPAQADKKQVVELKPPSLRGATVDQVCQWFITAPSQPDALASVLHLASATIVAREHQPILVAQAQARKEKALKDPPIKDSNPPRRLVLGDDGYFIRAEVNTRGGGIQRLTLTKFQEATDEGQPAFLKGKDGKPVKKPLDLIPDDPVVPSFLLYHYSDIENEVARATLGQVVWTVERETQNAEGCEIVLSFDKIPGFEGLKLRRTYTLKPKEYHIGLQVEIIDNRVALPDAPLRPFQYQLAGAHGIPIEGEWYTYTFRNPLIGLLDGRGNLWRDLDETQHRISMRKGGDKIRPGDGSDSFIQFAGIGNQYFTSLIVVDDKQVKGIEPKFVLNYARPTLESEEKKGRIRRILPDQSILLDGTDKEKEKEPGPWAFKLLPRALEQLTARGIKDGDDVLVSGYPSPSETDVWIATEIRKGKEYRWHLDDFTVRVVSAPLKPGASVTHKYLLYNGPAKVRLLSYFRGDQEVEPDLVTRYSDTLHLRTVTDYRSAGWPGDIAQFLRWSDLLILTTRLMHWLLDKLHLVLPQWGLVIVALTVLVRGLMFPISRKQALSSMRMQALAPEMQKLKEKFKGEPQAQQAAVMELYRKHKINPMAGCLPIFLQMPIFLGLYYCLQESIFFRLSGFAWMDNLAAPDMLIWWSEKIPWLSDPDAMGGILYLGPYFNLLPGIAVGLMLVQQKMTMPPATTDEQEMQQKMMKYMMIVMGVMFYKVAAGLCLYFIASSLWGLAEKQLLPKVKREPQPGQTPIVEEKKIAPPPNAKQRRRTRERDRGKPRVDEPDTAVKKVKDWWQEVLKQAKKK